MYSISEPSASRSHRLSWNDLGPLIITFFLLSISLRVFAGNEVGNGGRSIVCPKRVEFLDLFEAKVLRGTDADTENLAADPYEIVRSKLKLLQNLDSKTASLLENSLDRLKKDIHFEKNISLLLIDDSKHSFEPQEKGCHSEQLAVLRKAPLPGEKRILVNDKLWKKMPPLHQAAMLLHEVWYEYLALLGEKDSTRARYLVSYMFDKDFRKKSPKDYWTLITSLRLPIYKTYPRK